MAELVCVTIMDRHRLFREALAARLSAEKNIRLALATECLSEFLSLSPRQEPEVALVDVNGTGREGVDRIWHIKTRLPRQRIIALGTTRAPKQERRIVEYLEAGAVAYLTRQTTYPDLVQTIRDVADGRVPCDAGLLLKVVERIRQLCAARPVTGQVRRADLTAREREIAELVAAGLLNKEISRRLGISLSTTKNHVHNILQKMGCHSRREVVEAITRGTPRRSPDGTARIDAGGPSVRGDHDPAEIGEESIPVPGAS